MTDERLDPLRRLGYSPMWREYGLVGEAFLQNQADRFATSDDKSTEHYRYGAFRAVLAQRTALSDAEIARYVELAELDADTAMGRCALSDLIHWHGLTGDQFNRLASHPACDVPFLQRGIARKRLMERVRGSPLTDSLFEECLAFRDSAVQRLILEVSRVRRQQVERLAEGGSSRAVRNLATDRLRKKGRGG